MTEYAIPAETIITASDLLALQDALKQANVEIETLRAELITVRTERDAYWSTIVDILSRLREARQS